MTNHFCFPFRTEIFVFRYFTRRWTIPKAENCRARGGTQLRTSGTFEENLILFRSEAIISEHQVQYFLRPHFNCYSEHQVHFKTVSAKYAVLEIFSNRNLWFKILNTPFLLKASKFILKGSFEKLYSASAELRYFFSTHLRPQTHDDLSFIPLRAEQVSEAN